METIAFIVFSLVAMAAWKFVLRKSFLDHVRDELFDLRDELRAKFIENGWSLDSEAYKRARDLINAHLRLTDNLSVWRIVYTQVAVNNNPSLAKEIEARFEARFANVPRSQAKFVQDLRVRSLNTVMGFAVFNSFPLLVIGTLVLPFVLLERIVSALRRGLGVFFNATYQSLAHFEATLTDFICRAVDLVANFVFQPSIVEGYSVRRAKG